MKRRGISGVLTPGGTLFIQVCARFFTAGSPGRFFSNGIAVDITNSAPGTLGMLALGAAVLIALKRRRLNS